MRTKALIKFPLLTDHFLLFFTIFTTYRLLLLYKIHKKYIINETAIVTVTGINYSTVNLILKSSLLKIFFNFEKHFKHVSV